MRSTALTRRTQVHFLLEKTELKIQNFYHFIDFNILGYIHEDRLRELLTTMGDRFTDDQVTLSCSQQTL